MQTQADMGIGPVSCGNFSVFKKGEGGPEAPGALRLRNKKATASVASSYSENAPVDVLVPFRWLAVVYLDQEPGTRNSIVYSIVYIIHIYLWGLDWRRVARCAREPATPDG